MRYAVSACLAGHFCRYDGSSHPCAPVVRLVQHKEAVPLCPECLGGLETPRIPCECREGRVISRDGRDMTELFAHGAAVALAQAQKEGCTAAILKSRSPSCGFGLIYDGSFRGTLFRGEGIWAALLRRAGFALFSEENLPEGM